MNAAPPAATGHTRARTQSSPPSAPPPRGPISEEKLMNTNLPDNTDHLDRTDR